MIKKAKILLIVSLFATCAFANNLQMGPSLCSRITNIYNLPFNGIIAGKLQEGPGNWDAVWVFVKYQNCATNNLPWQHVGLSTTSTDHTVTGGVLQIDAVSDGKGVFIHRIASGSGSIASTTVTLKMAITDASYNYQVNGIEMVYIPGGNTFYVGDGNRGGGNLYGFCSDGSFDPVTINADVQNTNGLTAAQYVNQNVGWG